MRRLLIALTLALPLFAHEGLHEQIEEVTRLIAQQPQNAAALYLRRGELHRLHREPELAAADYAAARQIDPSLIAVELARGTLLVDTGHADDAEEHLRKYVAERPDDIRGRVVLARALMRLGRPAETAAELKRVVAVNPDPDYVVELAHALVTAGKPAEAVEAIDDVQRRVGSLVTLQSVAIDIDTAAGKYDAALRRIAVEEARAVRKEPWIAQRGDVLLKAGRVAEARSAYAAALDAIAALPPNRRAVRMTADLEQRLRRALDDSQ